MILNNKLTQDLLNLEEKFQNCQLDFVSSHKHLALTFSDDLTWTVYINSIIANAKKKARFDEKTKISP